MSPQELLPQVRDAIAEIEAALQQGKFSRAQPGYPSPAEMITIQSELRRIETELVSSMIPPKGQRSLWIGRIVSDTWWKYDRQPLTKKLLAISDAYRRKLRASDSA